MTSGRAKLTCSPATAAEKPVIERLIQLYLYDAAAEAPFPIGPDGHYGYDLLDRFWQHPYLLRQGREIAGFALVIDGCPITGMQPCWFMAEFFVLRPLRRRGLGRDAMDAILGRHPGVWHIATHDGTVGGAAFWDRVLAPHSAQTSRCEFDGATWVVRSFASSQKVAPW